MDNYYAQNPDVWVFGTVDGYLGFAALLSSRVDGSTEETTVDGDPSIGGMFVRVLPTCENPSRPFLVIQERVIAVGDRAEMELLIGGCRRGFANLRDAFMRVMASPDGPSDHVHVDDAEPFLVLPAVFLNLRAPVAKWIRHLLGDYWACCSPAHRAQRLPSGYAEMPVLANPPSSLTYSALHGRIPLAGTA